MSAAKKRETDTQTDTDDRGHNTFRLTMRSAKCKTSEVTLESLLLTDSDILLQTAGEATESVYTTSNVMLGGT